MSSGRASANAAEREKEGEREREIVSPLRIDRFRKQRDTRADKDKDVFFNTRGSLVR
jgi:hypothetical protein